MALTGLVVCLLCLVSGKTWASSPHVEFTSRDAVLQTATCSSTGGEPNYIMFCSSPKDILGMVDSRQLVFSSQKHSVAVWGSVRRRLLNLAWEQSDALDLRLNHAKYQCQSSDGSKSPRNFSALIQNKIPATRWEWFVSNTTASVSVMFRYGSGNKVRVPVHGHSPNGVMHFVGHEPEIVLYRWLQNNTRALLVLLLSKTAQSAVHSVECELTLVDRRVISCPAPFPPPSSNKSTASFTLSDCEVVGVSIGSVLLPVAVLVVCWCCWRKRCSASDAGRQGAQKLGAKKGIYKRPQEETVNEDAETVDNNKYLV